MKHFCTAFLCVMGLLMSSDFVFGEHSRQLLADPYAPEWVEAPTDTVPTIKDRKENFVSSDKENPFDLNDPSSITREITYDPVTGQYIVREKIGEFDYRPPMYMSLGEYLEYQKNKDDQSYFRKLAGLSSGSRGSSGKTDPVSKIDLKQSLIDRLFGGSEVVIKPQGYIDLELAPTFQVVQNPILPVRQQRTWTPGFDMNPNISASGKIGEKLNLNFNYNSSATFDLDQQLKLSFDSDKFSEDDIIKKIEAGNVSLPLRSSLIQGSQNMFGLLTEMQFGRLRLIGVASQQRSKAQNLQVQGGSRLSEFEVYADNYDENRHFFLSQFNRQQFEPTLKNLPQINTLFKITRIEVWVTNDRYETQNVRDIVAIADLGEYDRMTNTNPDQWRMGVTPPKDIFGRANLPDNYSNAIYQTLINTPGARTLDRAVSELESSTFGLQQVRDFEKVRARLLNAGSEYTYNDQLGYISLNVNLRQDQVIGVAYEYTYKGKTYQVGELSNDSPNDPDTLGVLFVKLLKGTGPRVDLPTWDLMMKNFYNLGAYQIDQEDFQLDVYYDDPGEGQKRFLPAADTKNIPLITLFNLDNLNTFGDPQPDGVFDFVPGLTIYPQNGRIMFPVLEPFGSSLAHNLSKEDSTKYTYQQLYDSTITIAREYPQLNRFVIRGKYKSSGGGSNVSLGGFNIPQGSVKVTANGQVLQEGVHYRVDYTTGQVTIIDESLKESAVPINISYEDNSLFGLQNRTMMGLRAEYEFRNKLVLGATTMKLYERPFTQKVNVGEDPINNSIYGLDVTYSNDAPWLTKMVDALPGISTKAKSTFAVQAEVAALRPGHSRAINLGNDKGGVTYVDDFEGSTSSIQLGQPANQWSLASVPQGDDIRWPEADTTNNLETGYNRARLAWYRIDRSSGGGTCDGDNDYVKIIDRNEIFPEFRNNIPGFNQFFSTFDLTYWPDERGPYNFDPPQGSEFSKGIDNTGKLRNPEERWAGIQRSLLQTDFEESNIEYIDIWLLNPFMDKCDDPDGVSSGGKLIIDLGNISEDILRDSRRFFENGLPRPNSQAKTDETVWGRIPRVQAINNAFDNDPAVREIQDVGLDGLDDASESTKFQPYLQALNNNVDPADIARFRDDPAGDNFVYFDDYPQGTNLLERYKAWNNPQGNSKASDPGSTRVRSYTNYPDAEDLNRDNTLNESEAFYRYEIPIDPDGVGGMAENPYITDRITSNDGRRTWYRLKIPVHEFSENIGGIQGFRSIRFARMILRGFDKRITFRFGQFDLVRNQWRRYTQSLCGGDVGGVGGSTFDLNDVNIEEHSRRTPFPYIIPPGITRENTIGPIAGLQQNEQSLSMDICDLEDGCGRAIYKNVYRDLRNYERLKMFVHAEKVGQAIDGEMKLFIRMGSDFINNYYEYEIPLMWSDSSKLMSSLINNALVVWRQQNNIDIDLTTLVKLKRERDRAGVPINDVYISTSPEFSRTDTTLGSFVMKIKGSPNLGLVKTIMIGLRNPSVDEDEIPPRMLCAEVWINELRVTGLNEQGGVAGLARMDFQLADVGSISLAGNFNTIGWGSMDQRVDQRSQETHVEYNVSANIQLDKFLKENTTLRIPLFAQYGNAVSTPKYDPYDLDVRLKDKLADADDPAARDSIRSQAIDKSTITSVNLTNVRKVRKNAQDKPKPWDIENLSATYAYSEQNNQNPIIAQDKVVNHRAELEYNYSRRTNYIEPFKNIGDSKWLKPIKDFNFNPIPNTFGANITLNRVFGEKDYRFSDPVFRTWFNKRFLLDRSFALQWDLAKSLKLNFNAETNAVVDEPDEYIDRFAGTRISTQYRRDSIWNNLKHFGRNKNYMHNVNLSYTAPTKSIPIIDWINLRGTLGAQYSWSARALNVDSLGNILQNSQTRSVSADMNFEAFYNKWNYLSKINGNKNRRNTNLRRSTTRSAPQDTTARGKAKEKVPKDREVTAFEKVLIRPLLLVRRARFNYQETVSSVVPGFNQTPTMLGLSRGFAEPGWSYVAGFTPSDSWLDDMGANHLITNSPFINDEFIRNKNQRIDGQVTLEPIPDLQIDVTANRNYTENHSEFYRNCDYGEYNYMHQLPRDVGTYTVSYLVLNGLFDNETEALIQKFMGFESTREVISHRIGTGTNPKEPDYAYGYGRYQSDVLIPAFLSAYTGESPDAVNLDVFKVMPRPNWQVTYNGLQKLKWFSDWLAGLTLTHGYQGSVTVSSYNTDVDYFFEDPLSINNINPLTQNYYSRFEIPSVVISEGFNPLIGVDVKTKNDITMAFNMANTRNLALNLIDFQLIESNTKQTTLGVGYSLHDVNIPFLTRQKNRRTTRQRSNSSSTGGTTPQGAPKKVKGNDLNFRFDYSLRDDVTINHILDQNQSEPTRGTKTISIAPSVDYQVNNNLNLRLFVDYSQTQPKTSLGYPITRIQGGIRVRLELD